MRVIPYSGIRKEDIMQIEIIHTVYGFLECGFYVKFLDTKEHSGRFTESSELKLNIKEIIRIQI